MVEDANPLEQKIADAIGMDLWRPARIYLAARYSRKDELRGYREDIQKLGHEVTSRWLDSKEAIDLDMSSLEACIAANTDVEDILGSDVLVLFTENPKVGIPRGGRLTELGIAIGLRLNGLGPSIFLVGEKENVFMNLQEIDGRFNTWASLVDALQKASLCHGESKDGRWCGLHPWHMASSIHREDFPHPLAGVDSVVDACLEELERWGG